MSERLTQIGGRCEIVGPSGEGTTVTLTIALAKQGKRTSMKSPIRVSLVEDDEEVRENIAGYLSTADGFECVGTHASAEDAVINLPAETPDVVLMDINLEEMDGIDCIGHLKPLLPKGQIVMLTAFEDADVIFKALSAGASGYLLKRMPPAQLLEAIREVQRGGAPMSASIARKVVLSFQKRNLRPATKMICPRESGKFCKVWRRDTLTRKSRINWA